MKAVVYKDIATIEIQDKPEPEIEAPTDAILKITSAAICGSDLHMYGGRTPDVTGKTLGHEIMGVIEKVGPAVTQLKVGDRVVLPFNIGCGACFNCSRGWTSACLTLNPENAGAGYGYAGLGPYQGGQAEKVRVPYADFNALKLPGKPGDEHEDDFLMLADIFPTAYHAAVLAQVDTGKSVAIYGAGPVGLLSVVCARLMGAADIYVVDGVTSRLDKAKELGAIPVNFHDGSPLEQIKKLRQQSPLADSLRDGEEKILEGVECGIDAIGYQAHDFDDPGSEKSNQVLNELIELVNPTGAIGVIGVYMPEDPGAPTKEQQQGTIELNYGLAWNKGITIAGGQCPVKRYNLYLRDLILAGQARPGTIVTHHIDIDEAPGYYQRFNDREERINKVVITPEL